MVKRERVTTAGEKSGSRAPLAMQILPRVAAKIVSGFKYCGYQGVKPMLDDAELLRSYADERSEAAFAELVRRHVDLVYSAALRRVGGDSHLAEDVCQKVFVGLAGQAGDLRQRRTITGWLYTASRFAAAEVVRGEQRRRAREQEAFVMNELLGNSAHDPDWEKLHPVLDAAMDELNESDREALLLRFFENQPLVEVGRKLAVSEEAARKRVDRALEKLRTLLETRGIGSTTAAFGLMLANHTVAAAPATLVGIVANSAVLAGSGTALPLAAVFHAMNLSKIAVGVVGMVFLFTLGIVTHKAWVRSRSEGELLVVEKEYERVRLERTKLERFARESETDLATLRAALETAQAADAAAKARVATAAQAAKEAAAWNPLGEGQAFLARHPEVVQRLLDFQNAQVDFKYGTFYRSHGLAPEEIEQFRALMRDTSPLPWNTGFSGTGRPLILTTGENVPSAEIIPRLLKIVGEAGVKEMIKAQEVSFGRDLAAKVATHLHFTDAPLTTGQAQALAELMRTNRTVKLASGGKGMDWDAASAAARGMLSEAQLPALETVRLQEEASQAAAMQRGK